MRVDKYVPVLKSILKILGMIDMNINKKDCHMLYVLHLFFAVVAPNTDVAICSETPDVKVIKGGGAGPPRVRIQCMQGEEELLEDPGHAQGLWMTAWRCAPPIRWVDISTKIQ